MTADPASLENLRDLALPAPVAWWPPAPGWWILAAGLVVAGMVAAWLAWRRYRADAYRRQARRELDAVARRLDAGLVAGAAADLAAVLKRTALAAFPRRQVASLTGPAWLTFLDRTGNTTAFTEGNGRWIERWAYAGDANIRAPDLKAALLECRTWVAVHERSGGREPC